MTQEQKEVVLQAVGHATMCWEPIPSGTFDTEATLKAAQPVVDLVDDLNAKIAKALDVAEMLMVVVCNASVGNWERETQEWQECARKWVDEYHIVAKECRVHDAERETV